MASPMRGPYVCGMVVFGAAVNQYNERACWPETCEYPDMRSQLPPLFDDRPCPFFDEEAFLAVEEEDSWIGRCSCHCAAIVRRGGRPLDLSALTGWVPDFS